MSGDSVNDFFERGVDLFNRGEFFACHEEWEQLWLKSEGEEKRFYQGLIQAAVAILHARRGNLSGARSMYSKARLKLVPLPAVYKGIRLGEFREDLDEFMVAAVHRSHPELFMPPTIRKVAGARD